MGLRQTDCSSSFDTDKEVTKTHELRISPGSWLRKIRPNPIRAKQTTDSMNQQSIKPLRTRCRFVRMKHHGACAWVGDECLPDGVVKRVLELNVVHFSRHSFEREEERVTGERRHKNERHIHALAKHCIGRIAAITYESDKIAKRTGGKRRELEE